jgi:hypothetical protein
VVEQLLKGGSAGLQEDTPTMDCCLIGSWPALSGSAEEKLSPMGQTIYQLLTTSDPVQTKQLWGKLTPEIQKTLNNLSPHLKVNQLRAKIAIIHTATDDVIPWVESPKLADAIDDEQEVYFKIFHRFYHTDIKQLLSTRLSQFADTVSEATGFYLYICSILYQL